MKKQDPFFAALAAAGEDCATVAAQAARWVRGGTAPNPTTLSVYATRQNQLAEQLLAAFVTPIDRRDLFLLSRHTLALTRELLLLPLQMELPALPAQHRQKAAKWVENCGLGAKNVLCAFANYKKYAILQQKIHSFSRAAATGLQLCELGGRPFEAPPNAALFTVARAALVLADVAMEALIANL